MKPLNILIDALQDIVARSFSADAGKIRDIRELAQEALKDYKKVIPKPKISCPKDFTIGEDYKKFDECGRCPDPFAQICSIYNYVWYKREEDK